MKTLYTPFALALMLTACGGETTIGADPAPIVAAKTSSQQSASQQISASDYHDVVQKIYVGYFGRPADPAGLAFFANRLLALGAPTTVQGISDAYRSNPDVRAVVDVFGTSQESADLYPGTNSVFMDAVYRNLFSRQADIDGKAFWVSAIDAGLVTRGDAAVSVMAGAQNEDITVINKKATVAAFFTGSLSSSVKNAAYAGVAANTAAREMLNAVTLATDTTAFQTTVSSTLNTLVAALPPAGLYFGKLGSSGQYYQAMVLENGQYWGLNSQSNVGHFLPIGVLHGTLAVSNGQFSSSDIRYMIPQPAAVYSYSGNLVPQTSMSGTLSITGGSIPLANATPLAAYDFNVPAKASDIEGAWTMRDAENAVITVNVTGTGITGSAGNCNFSGTLTPRASGKNVFDAAITYGPLKAGQCRLANQSVSGIAYAYSSSEFATRQFFVALTNTARSNGNVLRGAKAQASAIAPAFSMTDTLIGSGAVVTAGRPVIVQYTGWLYNAALPNQRGAKFDSSFDAGSPFEFTLGVGQVIQGWDQGVAGMRVGGKRTLVIPASLGYGDIGAGPYIVSNSSLVFDVEVIGVR